MATEEEILKKRQLTSEQEQDMIARSRGLGKYSNEQATESSVKNESKPSPALPSIQANVKSDKPERTHTDRMKELFALRSEKPMYDAQRPEELKRLARNSVIAKGINLIGDNIALAKGANVNRRKKDNIENVYLKQMYNYLDDYNKRVDNWNWRDFSSKLRVGELGLSQDNWNRAFDQRQGNADRVYAYGVNKDERDYRTKQENFDKDFALDVEKFKQSAAYQRMTVAERERHNKQMELASLVRASNTGRTTKEPFKLYDSKGNQLALDNNEREKILSLILADPEIEVTQDDMDLLEPKMGEPVSTNSMNLLVQKYWQRSKAVESYLNERNKAPEAGAKAETKTPSFFE